MRFVFGNEEESYAAEIRISSIFIVDPEGSAEQPPGVGGKILDETKIVLLAFMGKCAMESGYLLICPATCEASVYEWCFCPATSNEGTPKRSRRTVQSHPSLGISLIPR